MDPETTKKLYEKLFWIKIAISIFLGVAAYYSLDAAWPFQNLLADLIFIVLIHFFIVTIIPYLIIRFKTQSGWGKCFIEAMRTVRTQALLFFLIGGLTFMVNI